MNLGAPRLRAALLCAAALLALAVAAQAATPRPDQLVVLSMSDTRARIVPCGCTIPRGGLSRQAFFVDSVRALYGHALLVDNGGYFPGVPDWQEDADFMMKGMRAVGFQAVGVAARDLDYGLPFLAGHARAAGLPLTCANLLDAKSGKPVFAPSMLLDANGVKVGVFALIGDEADLGPSRAELRVEAPATAAARAVKDLRARGAQAIVLLSQLGTVASEEMASGVPGIDVIVVGRSAPYIERGKRVGNTVLAYSGESGYFMGATTLSRGADGRFAAAESRAVTLGPEVGDDVTLRDRALAFSASMAAKRKVAAKK